MRLELLSHDNQIDRDAVGLASDLLNIVGIETHIGVGNGFPVKLDIDGSLHPEGYKLLITQDSIFLTGADASGLFYAGQTLLQIIAFSDEGLQLLEIDDWPHYKKRELMVDMGRGVFSFVLLKRIIRIMSRLKLNSLHLHLYDDHLNSLKFDNLPLGSENPWAISIDQLRQLVAYARQHHISIVPELESWGHAGSILYHYPELYGAPGMWEGFSFGIGEELFALVEKMLDEVIPVLEEDCFVHLGLDEAKWALLPSAQNAPEGTYTPEKLVGRFYDILQQVGLRHGRKPTLRIWADHGGRPVPEEIRDKVITEPWQYFEREEDDIKAKLAAISGEGKPPFMMGAGMSSLHQQGAYGATRIWCREGVNSPNVAGVNICMWEGNDLASHLIGVYAGAGYAWAPTLFEPLVEESKARQQRGRLIQRMKKWQIKFTDASDAEIRLDMGADVYQGIYNSGPLAGEPVAPTALLVKPVYHPA